MIVFGWGEGWMKIWNEKYEETVFWEFLFWTDFQLKIFTIWKALFSDPKKVKKITKSNFSSFINENFANNCIFDQFFMFCIFFLNLLSCWEFCLFIVVVFEKFCSKQTKNSFFVRLKRCRFSLFLALTKLKEYLLTGLVPLWIPLWIPCMYTHTG